MTTHSTQHATESGTSSTPATTTEPARTERVVEQAARESFPASDPPSFTPLRAVGSAGATADEPPIVQDEHRESARQWAQGLTAAFDACDADAVANLLTEDAVVRIGMAPLLVGRDAARRWLVTHFERVGSAIHHVTDTRVDRDALVIEADVNVRTADGVKMNLPEAISVRLRGESASRLTVYGGPAGMYPTPASA